MTSLDLFHRRLTAGTLIATLSAALAGCAVGPDYQRPTAPTAANPAVNLPAQTMAADAAHGQAQRFVQGMDLPGQWWTLFHSPALDRAVRQAIAGSPDLDAARAALRAARESARAEAGAYYPSLQADFQPSRIKNANGSVASSASSGAAYYSIYTASVSVSYVPDVFGATRRAVEAADAQTEAQRFQMEATYLTLTTNVANVVVTQASLRAQIAATEEIIKVESDVRDLLRRQKALGQVPLADVVQQEATLAQTRQTLPGLKKQLAQAQDQLVALLGHLPGDTSQDDDTAFDLAAFDLPTDLPVSIPAKLVEQRPDIRAAEANLHAASAGIGVAMAARLPNLTLTAGNGSSANRIGDLFTPGNGFWSIGADLMQPIFQGGTLEHKQRAAEANYDQAAAQYRGTVVTAFQNVTDTLQALRYDADALREADLAEKAAVNGLEISRERRRLGDVDALVLLNAQQTYQQALITRVQAQATRYADTVALFQALGGGWWNREEDIALSGTAQDGDNGASR